MTKKAFEAIREGLLETIEIVEARADPMTYRVHTPVDVKAIRTALGLSQGEFARDFGLPKATVQDWEQGRRRPETSALVLLRVIAKEPETVRRAVHAPG